jgi:hypothetical protein
MNAMEDKKQTTRAIAVAVLRDMAAALASHRTEKAAE